MIVKRHVLFDIDHTLSDASPRDHLIAEAMRSDDWTGYHSLAPNDLPCHDLVAMLTCFRHCGYTVIGITARPMRWRSITVDWLYNHGIHLDELLMHKRDNFEPSAELKLALARERFGAKISDHVLFIIDDHEQVAKAFQAVGVTSLQVRGRKY